MYRKINLHFILKLHLCTDNHYYEKFEDGTVNDITDEIPFDLPESWRWTRMINIGTWKSGSTPSKAIKEYYQNGVIPWVITGDLNNSYIYNASQNITKIALEKTSVTLNEVDSVLIAMYGATIGKLGILKIPATTNQACCACKVFHNIYNEYLFYYLMSRNKYFKKIAEGGAQPNISREKIIHSLFALPPLAEQQRIVEKIEQLQPYIEEYDKKYTKLEKLNNTYKEELKKSILQYAIQGKLVKQDFTDEPASILIDKIIDEKHTMMKNKEIKKENLSVIYQDSKDKQFYEKFDDGKIVNITDEIPFDIPDNWVWTRLKNICIINPRNDIDDNMEVSFIPMNLIESGYISKHSFEVKQWKDIKKGFTHFKENDIGIAKITPCFQNRKSVIFENLKNGYGAGTTELHILRTINADISNKYLFYIIKSVYFITNGVSTYSRYSGTAKNI